MTTDTTPRFSVADAIRFADEHFDLSAHASPLPSERDQNFVLTSAESGRFVLKIAKSDEERPVLDFQNALLARAAIGASCLAMPRVIPNMASDPITIVMGASGQSYFLRLMTWLDGDLLVHAQPHCDTLLGSLGTALAELDLAVNGFSHPAMRRELDWDVSRAGLALRHLSALPEEQRVVVRRFLSLWEAVSWGDLRRGVIHGDANDYNVLVQNGRVVGFLDFGDAVYTAVACDLAIALAYAMLDKPNPIEAAVAVIRAYNLRFPLTDAEAAALYPLTTARLCMSVCYAAYNAHAKSADAYQQVTAVPAWSLLRQLAGIPDKAARNAFLQACVGS